MPKTRINCPNCRQPIGADIEQLHDVNVDLSAKQRLLSGAYNLVQCPHCGYQGNLATLIVYHDPAKELLLTYVPPEIGLPRNEQERMLGSLINQVANKLPQEKRKAYLLRPQANLTMQGLIERILEADGITREMVQAQQQRLNLIQQLINTSKETLPEVAQQEDALMDASFFGLLRRLVEASLMGGDQESAQQLAKLQDELLPLTTFGRELQAQSREVEAAVKDLQAAGKGLTKEKLLKFFIDAENETRLRALVSLTRPAIDYTFFQMLSEKIDRSRGDGRTRLVALREKLLDLTRELDQQIEKRALETRLLLDKITQAEDVSEAMMQNLPAVDDFFLHELNQALESARQKGDLDKIAKFQKMMDVLQQVSAPPPEIELVEELLDTKDDQEMRLMLEDHREEITPDFLNSLANIVAQVQNTQDTKLIERIKTLNRMAVRFSMENNLRK